MDALEVIRQLEADAGLRAQLRAVLLGDGILELPELFRQFLETQARTEAHIGELAEAQRQLSAKVAEYVETTNRHLGDLDRDMAETKGSLLETKIGLDPRRFVPRRIATRVRVVSDERLDLLLGDLPADTAADVELADAFLDARLAEGDDVVLVVEAAGQAHVDDLERALRRAERLTHAGVATRAVVVSHLEPHQSVLAKAASLGVVVVGESRGLLTPEHPPVG